MSKYKENLKAPNHNKVPTPRTPNKLIAASFALRALIAAAMLEFAFDATNIIKEEEPTNTEAQTHNEPHDEKINCTLKSKEVPTSEETTFGNIYTEARIYNPNRGYEPLPDEHLILKDPKFQDSLKKFREEASRQVNLVEQSGGYCKLPDRKDLLDTSDTKIPETLYEIKMELDSYLDTTYPKLMEDEGIEIIWKVDLGRSECEPAHNLIPWEEFTNDEKIKTDLEKKLKPVVREFNANCAATQGGLLNPDDFSIDTDSRAFDHLLYDRGTAIVEALPTQKVNELRAMWYKKFVYKGDIPTTDLSPIQEEQFRSSLFLYETVFGPEATWVCPNDSNQSFDGIIARERLAGINYTCVHENNSNNGHYAEIDLNGGVYDKTIE